MEKEMSQSSTNNFEITFYRFGALSVFALFPLLFIINNSEENELESSLQTDTFKAIVWSSLVIGCHLTLDLFIDFFSSRALLGQTFVRVVMCGTLVGTSCLQIYFSSHQKNELATRTIMLIRDIMCAVVASHQVHVRSNQVLANIYLTYTSLVLWNVGTVFIAYELFVPKLQALGNVSRIFSMLIAFGGVGRHMLETKGDVLTANGHNTCQQLAFKMLMSVTMSLLFVVSCVWQLEGEEFVNNDKAVLVMSLTSVLFLVLLSTIINHEHRHEFEQIQKKLEIKQLFVRHVSHEIRTPLNCCQLGVKYLKTAILNPSDHSTDELMGILDEVTEGCNSALGFVNNLLMYEKIDTSELPLFLKRENLNELCEKVYKSFVISTKELGVTLSLDIHKSFLTTSAASDLPNDNQLEPFVNIDGPKIIVVLRNFVSNALKFTPRGGRVTLSVTPVNKAHATTGDETVAVKCNSFLLPPSLPADTTHFRVMISDTGQGMSQEEQKQLFTKIVQFSPNEKQNGGGSGIGLFLSHHIVRDHKLKIHVHSEGVVGKGMQFFIDFPRYWEEFDNNGGDQTTNSSSGLSTSVLGQVFPCLATILVRNVSPTLLQEHAELGDEEEGQCQIGCSRAATVFPSCATDNNNNNNNNNSNNNTATTATSSRTNSPPSSNNDDEMRLFIGGQSKLLSDLSILVVDDSDLNRKMLIRTLKQHHVGAYYEQLSDGVDLLQVFGVPVDEPNPQLNHLGEKTDPEASNGKNGKISVSIKHNTDYDVILLDNCMTHMDGSVAIRRLRECGYDGLVIGLTGSAGKEELASFCVAGANYSLSKPYDIEQVIDVILHHQESRL